jgi:hypothetical protein
MTCSVAWRLSGTSMIMLVYAGGVKCLFWVSSICPWIICIRVLRKKSNGVLVYNVGSYAECRCVLLPAWSVLPSFVLFKIFV